MNMEDINPEFFHTLLQMDLKQYEKYRSVYPFLKPFNLMLALHTHDLEKTLDWQHHEILKELGEDHEVTKMYAKLVECLNDIGSVFARGRIKDDRILKKYSHNIMSVLSDNNLLLTTMSEKVLKEEVGNKAYSIWTMAKEGLPVPPAFFLTFAACRMSYAAKTVVPGIVRQCMYYFKGKPVAIRSSGLVSMPGQMETIYVTDSFNYETVENAIMQVISSWFSDYATKYRKIIKMDTEMQMGVVIQELVKADNENGFSGNAYSRNPNTGVDEICGEVLFEEMGMNLVSGKKTPQDLKSIPEKYQIELSQHLKKLEEKFKKVQYSEFACDGENLYMLQFRDAKLTDLAQGRVGVAFFKKGWMDLTRFERLYTDLKFNKALRKIETTATPIAKGIASSAGIVVGKILLNSSSRSSDNKYIWFTNITTPQDLPRIKYVDGIVTTQGGYTSHAAEVSRMLKKPAIVSASHVEIHDTYVIINGKRYNENDTITIIGETGEIFENEIQTIDKFVLDDEFKTALKDA